MTHRVPNIRFKAEGNSAEILIHDDIGPSEFGMIDSKLIARMLKEIGDVKTISVRINSRGGAAFDGIAIHNLLKEHPSNIVVKVDGLAGSAASLIAMAGDRIEMPANTMMMIHNAEAALLGGADDFRDMADRLEKLNLLGAKTYAAKTGLSEERVAQMMADETWLVATEAVELGFADKETKSVDVKQAATTGAIQFKHPPKQFESFFSPTIEIKGLTMSADPKKTNEPQQLTAEQMRTNNPEAIQAIEQAAIDKHQKEVATKDLEKLEADHQVQLKKAGDEAAENERKRQSDIRAICQQAGLPDKADLFCNEPQFSVGDVQEKLFDALCKNNKALGEDAGGDLDDGKDPDAKFKKEFAKQKDVFESMGVTEESYIYQRRVDEGLDILEPAKAE